MIRSFADYTLDSVNQHIDSGGRRPAKSSPENVRLTSVPVSSFLSACLKSPDRNHGQRKTAFQTNNGHSAWAMGTAHVAPKLPSASAGENVSLGRWKRDLRVG